MISAFFQLPWIVIIILIRNWIKTLCHEIEEVLIFDLICNMSPYVDN